MSDEGKHDAADTAEVFAKLEEAAKLYDQYRNLSTIARLATAHRSPVAAPPSWDHPLGIVINTVK